MFDFIKAFDMVPHATLLVKLSQIGFFDTAIKWIFSYLTGRLQGVIDDSTGAESKWVGVNVGVPQELNRCWAHCFSLYSLMILGLISCTQIT